MGPFKHPNLFYDILRRNDETMRELRRRLYEPVLEESEEFDGNLAGANEDFAERQRYDRDK